MSLALAACPPGQEPSTPSALSTVLERAARFQQGSAVSVHAGTLHGFFRAAVRKPDGSGMLEADVERAYQREPPRMVTTRVDGIVGSNTSVGSDGSVVWFRDNATGQVRIFDDDPETFETDLADMAWQLRLMAMVHDALVFERLLERLEDPVLDAQERLASPSRRVRRDDPGVLVDVVRGRLVDDLFEPDLSAPPPLPGDPLSRLEARLYLDAGSGALLKVGLRTLGRDEPRTIEVWFLYHRENAQGLQVPMTIKIMEDGLEALKLGLAADDEGYPHFSLGEPLDAALFAAPPRFPTDAGEDPKSDG